jgi:hypothetical protein
VTVGLIEETAKTLVVVAVGTQIAREAATG